MKTKYLTLIAIALLMLMPIHLDAQEKKEITLKQVSSFTGEIIKWLYDVNYIYNAFELKVGNKIYVVEFPTKLGSEIKALGNNVTVNGIVKGNKKYIAETIDMVNIQGKGKIIYKNQAKNTFYTSSLEKFRSGKGKIIASQMNEKKGIIGFIVDDYTVLRISAQAAEQLSQMIETNKTIIEYTGMEKKTESGEITKDNYKVIYCHTITINGTQYLVR